MVSKNANNDAAAQLQLEGTALSLFVKIHNNRKSFLRVSSEGRYLVLEAGSLVCGFSLKRRVQERPLPAMAAGPQLGI